MQQWSPKTLINKRKNTKQKVWIYLFCLLSRPCSTSFSKYTNAMATVTGCRPQSSPTSLISLFRLGRTSRTVRDDLQDKIQTFKCFISQLYLRILLRVSLMWGNFSLKVSFMSFFRSDGLTYSITVVWGRKKKNIMREKMHKQRKEDLWMECKQRYRTVKQLQENVNIERSKYFSHYTRITRIILQKNWKWLFTETFRTTWKSQTSQKCSPWCCLFRIVFHFRESHCAHWHDWNVKYELCNLYFC